MPLFIARIFGGNASKAILFLAVAGIILFQVLPGPHPLDDSYITYRYARNLSQGNGFVYNLDQQVQGTTTPLYTLLLALLALPFGSSQLPLISFVIAAFLDVINVILFFRVARHLLKHDGAALLAAVVFLFQPLRLNVATGGMETSLFITLLLAMYERYLVGKKVIAAAVFAAIAVLTRIDGVLAVAPLLLHALWYHRSQAVKGSLVAVGMLIPWFAWATWYFGNPIPHSILAKMAAYENSTISSSLIFLFTFLGTGTVGPYRQLWIILPGLVLALFLIIMGFRWLALEDKPGHEALLVIAYPFIYYFAMAAVSAPLFFCWYYLPLMPGFLVLFFGGLLFMTRKISPSKQIGALAGAALVLVCLPAVLMWRLPGWADSREVETIYHRASSQVESTLNDGDLVFAPDIGVIGWRLKNASILDPIGLVSPISVQYMQANESSNTVMLDLVNDQRPEYVIAREGFITSLLDDATFMQDYQLIWQETGRLPDTGTILVLERKSD